MDTNRLPKQALQYKPKGRRNIGQPRKRWRDQIHLEDQGTGNTPNPSEHDDDDDFTCLYTLSSKQKLITALKRETKETLLMSAIL